MRLIEIVNEGGWKNTLTQNTIITPELVSKCIPLYNDFVRKFNSNLSKQKIPTVSAGAPVGSTAYYKKDLATNPTAEYGDIDILMVIPKVPGKTNSGSQTFYQNHIVTFLEVDSPSYVEPSKNIQDKDGSYLIFKIENKYVQVDLIYSFKESADWTQYRLTPEYGTKGALYGLIFSSLGELMNLSLQAGGVQAKIKNDMPVSFRTAKPDRLDTISYNIEDFGIDLLNYFYRLQGNNDSPKISKLLLSNPGLDKTNISIDSLSKVIIGLADSFTQNDMWGKAGLPQKSAGEFINSLKEIYTTKINKSLNDTKFDKAETPRAIAKARETKDKLKKGLDRILNLFPA